MASRILRAAVVGASSLLGRELAEQLNEAGGVTWDLTLLDDEEAMGQVTVAGDEPLVIQAISPGVFERMDVVFFAGDGGLARTHWREAQAGGAGIVDLTGALAAEAGATVLAPMVISTPIDLTTTVVVSAHGAAVMLALVAARLQASFGPVRLIATVLEPASEQGKAALDELHQQTVGILSFQAVPKDVYDEQIAFNLLTELGQDSKASLDKAVQRIERDFVAVAGENRLAMQLVQAPVFNGYTASVFVQLPDGATLDAIRLALDGGGVGVATEEAVSNMAASSQKQLLVSAREAGVSESSFWLWIATDNLVFAAQNAMACGLELAKLRPAGKVQ